MTTKRLNPYQYLLKQVREVITKIKYRETKNMFFYSYKNLGKAWSMTQIYERTKAAEQLGYDVQVKTTDKGLQFFYIKKMPYITTDWLNY